MIIFDTETTGLVGLEAMPTKMQPHIVEIACLKFSDGPNMKLQGEYETLINPGIPIPPDASRIHGITNEMVAKAPSFAAVYNDLCTFFAGERILVAHNAAYDTFVLLKDLERIGKGIQFPWPWKHICTVESSMAINGRRTSLSDLYKQLLGKEFKEAHRAMKDTRALSEIVRTLIKQGLFPL